MSKNIGTLLASVAIAALKAKTQKELIKARADAEKEIIEKRAAIQIEMLEKRAELKNK